MDLFLGTYSRHPHRLCDVGIEHSRVIYVAGHAFLSRGEHLSYWSPCMVLTTCPVFLKGDVLDWCKQVQCLVNL